MYIIMILWLRLYLDVDELPSLMVTERSTRHATPNGGATNPESWDQLNQSQSSPMLAVTSGDLLRSNYTAFRMIVGEF